MRDAQHLVTGRALPVVVAPMTRVSTPRFVFEACHCGLIGALPAHNLASTTLLAEALGGIQQQLTEQTNQGESGLLAVNVVTHRTNTRLTDDLAVVREHEVPLVITSVGSPDVALEALVGSTTMVFASVSTLKHARRAIDLGVDGLILLTAGGGGQSGWANPFAFVRSIRAEFGGCVVLAGGISDGYAITAALVLGCDLVMMGTRFIPTPHSGASAEYRSALVAADIDDVTLTRDISGLPTNCLSGWLTDRSAESVRAYSQLLVTDSDEIQSAGHGVGASTRVEPLPAVVAELRSEFAQAAQDLARNTHAPV